MQRTIYFIFVVAGAALTGCSASPMSGTSQQSQPMMALHDFYRPAYEYSGSPVPSQLADTAQPADILPAHASGHR